MMDSTDDITYLNYLSDKGHSYLLQGSDDALGIQDPTLNGETIFEELDDGHQTWTIDSLPVLLNGSNVSDDEIVHHSINLESTKLEQNGKDLQVSNMEANESLTYPIEITGENFVTSNGLFLPNDILLQLNFQNEQSDTDDYQNHHIREDTLANEKSDIYNLNYETAEKVNPTKKIVTEASNQLINLNSLSSTGGIIQLLNIDGSVINVNKHLLNIQTSPKNEIEGVPHFSNMIETVEAHKCRKCGFLSISIVEITKHVKDDVCIKTKSENKASIKKEQKMVSVLNTNQDNQTNKQFVYLCSECDVGYATTTELKQHMIEEHKLINENGAEKEESAQQKLSNCAKGNFINIVKTQQKASKKVKCLVKGCESRFALDEFRIRHENCHVKNEKKLFKCPECNKHFSIWRICSLHLWKCHKIDVGLLSCIICGNFKSLSAYKLLCHMRIHNEEKQFLCNECGKCFKQLTQLRNHQVTHLKDGQDTPQWISQQKCDICNNYFANAKSLKKHVQCVHNKFKPYVCNICGHKTSRKAMLDLHLRQHTGEKPYKCEICKYRTGDHNSLRRHHMRHDGTTKYSCPYCTYQAIQSAPYKLHIITKHPGLKGLFCCKHCSFQTVNEHAFRIHTRTHEQGLLKLKGSSVCNVQENDGILAKDKSPVTEESTTKKNIDTKMDTEDDETQHGFLSALHIDETVDTGGITIPADLELQE